MRPSEASCYKSEVLQIIFYVGRVRIWNVSVIFKGDIYHVPPAVVQRFYNFERFRNGKYVARQDLGTIQGAVTYVWGSSAKQGVHTYYHTAHNQQHSRRQNPRKQLLFSGEQIL